MEHQLTQGVAQVICGPEGSGKATTEGALEALREIAGGVRLYGAPDTNLLADRIERRVDQLAAIFTPMRWKSATNGCPGYTEDRGMRVLVYTEGYDFDGAQIHDIPAADFYAYDPEAGGEPGTEVARHCSHWMYRHDAIAAAQQAQAFPARSTTDPHAYLCRAWGETDLPCVTIARSREEVRQFYVREWLGDENATDYDGTPTLPRLMEEFDAHPWGDGEPIRIEFEIGGVSVERVYA